MKTFCLLIDALNPSYLKYMPGLQKYVEKSASCPFQEPLGFTPREAYFGGLTPNESQSTHLFKRATGHYNPFELYNLLNPRDFGKLDSLLPRLLPPFAKLYGNRLNIPAHLISQFCLSENYTPWDSRKNYTSIFDELTQTGTTWNYIGWPFQKVTDLELSKMAQAQLQESRTFVFCHLSSLDTKGHIYGPTSLEFIQYLQVFDRLLQGLLSKVPQDYAVIIFGDHGMLPVHTKIALPLQNLPPHIPYFVDSTTFRAWPSNPLDEELVHKLLGSSKYYSRITASELLTYKAEAVDNGMLYWANPGVVFTPNFFGEGDVKGMHGYLPDVYDNQSQCFVLHPNVPSGSYETVEAWKLHSILRFCLGFTTTNPLTRLPEPNLAKLHTLLNSVEFDVRKTIPEIEALYLGGSIGRNPAAFLNGPLNDLDFFYSAKQPISASKLLKLRNSLEQKHQIKSVEFGYLAPNHPKPSSLDYQYIYDFSHGHLAVFGKLDVTPLINTPEIHSFHIQILNRVAGVLMSEISTTHSKESQVTKLVIAYVDLCLKQVNAYDPNYEVKLARLDLLDPELAQAFKPFLLHKINNNQLSETQLNGVLKLLRVKLSKHSISYPIQPSRNVKRFYNSIKTTILYNKLLNAFLNETPAPTLISQWLKHIQH